jgi:hypothetical protein
MNRNGLRLFGDFGGVPEDVIGVYEYARIAGRRDVDATAWTSGLVAYLIEDDIVLGGEYMIAATIHWRWTIISNFQVDLTC